MVRLRQQSWVFLQRKLAQLTYLVTNAAAVLPFTGSSYMHLALIPGLRVVQIHCADRKIER